MSNEVDQQILEQYRQWSEVRTDDEWGDVILRGIRLFSVSHQHLDTAIATLARLHGYEYAIQAAIEYLQQKLKDHQAVYLSKPYTQLAERDGGWYCHYCHARLAPVGLMMPTLDHILAQSKGGTDDIDNLVLACGPCNSAKRDRPYEDFLDKAIRERRI